MPLIFIVTDAVREPAHNNSDWPFVSKREREKILDTLDWNGFYVQGAETKVISHC
jgi:hypothetical protein